MPEFGDAIADSMAKEIYAQLYPGRAVIQIDIAPISAVGGIHCTTQQEII
ncbi:agmatine deiminase family protein [Comamonas testosteroni]|nr:agmatine deiminase family protein [Comamonas testosteroni]